MASNKNPKPAATNAGEAKKGADGNTGLKPGDKTNGGGTVVGVVSAESAAAEEAKRKEEKRKHTQEVREAQAETARQFKKLASGVTDFINAGGVFNLGKVFTNNDEVFEVINAGDRAIEVGFPTLDRPRLKASRGKTVDELKADRSAVLHRFVARELTEDEATAQIAAIENKIRRLQTAADKKTAAEKSAAEQKPAAGANA